MKTEREIMNMAQNLITLRERFGLCIETLARLIEVPAGALLNYERGVFIPSPERKEKIVKFYKINSFDALYNETI